MKTDYQARFGDFHSVAPPKLLGPRKPDINLFTTHMNLKTENQAAYKNFGKVDRPRQCKVSFVQCSAKKTTFYDEASFFK